LFRLYAKWKGNNQEYTDESAGVRQILGLQGAGETDNIWRIRLQHTNSIT
jgi:hypothetical protein